MPRTRRGQAAVETVAVALLLAAAAVTALAVLGAAWAVVEARAAAASAARARAGGGAPGPAARAALPPALRRGARVRVDGRGRVVVRVRPPGGLRDAVVGRSP